VDASEGAVCGVLDFGDMIHAPVVLEPAVAMSELLIDAIGQPGDMAAILEGYARLQTLCAADVDAIYDLVAGRHAVTLLIQA